MSKTMGASPYATFCANKSNAPVTGSSVGRTIGEGAKVASTSSVGGRAREFDGAGVGPGIGVRRAASKMSSKQHGKKKVCVWRCRSTTIFRVGGTLRFIVTHHFNFPAQIARTRFSERPVVARVHPSPLVFIGHRVRHTHSSSTFNDVFLLALPALTTVEDDKKSAIYRVSNS